MADAEPTWENVYWVATADAVPAEWEEVGATSPENAVLKTLMRLVETPGGIYEKVERVHVARRPKPRQWATYEVEMLELISTHEGHNAGHVSHQTLIEVNPKPVAIGHCGDPSHAVPS